MTTLAFVRSSSRDSTSPASNPARLINLYAEDIPPTGKASALLRATYGMELLADLPGVFVRDMYEYSGAVYVIQPGGFYRVTAEGVTTLATTATGETGNISRNLNAVTACIGGAYYVLNTTTNAVTSPATGLDGGVAWVAYLAGRTIAGEVGTGVFRWSDVADATVFPGLNVATAEAREDQTIRGIVVGNQIYLFGAKTTEVWQPEGAAESAFAPLGLVIDRGLKAFGLACVADGAIFFIGDDDIAYLMAGSDKRAISSPAVNSAIRDGEAQTCTFWEERGHKFCAITFRDRPTWVFDMATGLWWERAEGPTRKAWRGRICAKLGADWLVGATDGSVYKLRPIYTDAGEVHYREATSYALEREGEWFTVAKLCIKTGAGFASGSVMLEIGDGVSFGQVRHVPLPAVGDFRGRSDVRALGRRKIAVARISMTDPVDIPLYGDVDLVLA
jgi:hypothetical protein